jgi:putative restriction endonuclease
MRNSNWAREELIVAFNLYCKIPFSKTVKTNPEVIKVASLIERTPSAVAFKLGNFGSFDETLKKKGISGLPNASKLDKQIWDEFHNDWEKLAYESELLIAKFSNREIEEISEIDLSNIPVGRERESLVKTRINQSFFRSVILSSYNSTCCITGLNIPDFLVASHIIPWKKDEKNRLNPQNGLCLNSIHDRAFDKGYITVTPDYKVKVSKWFEKFESKNIINEFFLKYENQPIILPDKFPPNEEFLKFHQEIIFKK